MTLVRAIEEIEYPESDGEPMGETDLHRNWMIRIHDMLTCRYRGERVYVGSDLLVYFEEGSPYRYVVPDVFVVLDCPPGNRNTFKIWEEGIPTTVAFEVTSRSTRRRDIVHKPKAYAEIGVREYFLYDPTCEYLLPPLRGFRLSAESYTEIEPDFSGRLPSRELGLGLCLEAGRLVMYDQRTGQPLRTEAEIERRAREAAELRAAEESNARQSLEEEVQRLRELLRARSLSDDLSGPSNRLD
jgi:Uma2 family endonuclease